MFNEQYFSYIFVVSFIGGGTRVPRVNHQPVASHWQTLSHNVVLSTPRLNRIRTHNVSGDGTACPLNLSIQYYIIKMSEKISTIPRVNHRPAASLSQTLSHKVVRWYCWSIDHRFFNTTCTLYLRLSSLTKKFPHLL